jgi:hypothetical protein
MPRVVGNSYWFIEIDAKETFVLKAIGFFKKICESFVTPRRSCLTYLGGARMVGSFIAPFSQHLVY